MAVETTKQKGKKKLEPEEQEGNSMASALPPKKS
jgi:hypothetical protein